MTVESVCRRVTSGDETVTGTFTLLPELGVRLIPVMGSTKSKTLVPIGGVSYKEIVRFVVPPPQFVVQPPPPLSPSPLQAFITAIEPMASTPKYQFNFMHAPHCEV